ncbi:hypothetical protein IC575_007646 [Cucumis melo]
MIAMIVFASFDPVSSECCPLGKGEEEPRGTENRRFLLFSLIRLRNSIVQGVCTKQSSEWLSLY